MGPLSPSFCVEAGSPRDTPIQFSNSHAQLTPGASAPQRVRGDGAPGSAGPFLDAASRFRDTAASRRAAPDKLAQSGTCLERRFPSGAGPRFAPRLRSTQPRVSQLLAGGPSASGRSPGAARVRACEARPQAPHPAPPLRRLARAPLGERDKGNKSYFQIKVNMKLRAFVRR